MLNQINSTIKNNSDTELLTHFKNLTTFFQPIYSAEYMEIYGFEALTKSLKESIPITQLFDNAYRSNKLLLLDMYCRKIAFKNASLNGIGKKEHLFLNICPEILLSSEHRPQVTDYYASAYNIPKENIILEITEESAVRDYKTFLRGIEYYRTNGYKIAIDDFGVGFGGPKMLSEVKPDIVKIDRYFVSTSIKNKISKGFVKLIIELCNDMNILVLAEGIETQEEMELMIRLKTDLLQGYFLGRPVQKPKK